MTPKQPIIAVLWSQYGPYHLARFAALAELAGPANVRALEIADVTRHYHWNRTAAPAVITLCPGVVAEQLPFWTVFWRVRRKLAELGIEVCLLPSYWPSQSLAAWLAAKSLGIRVVMMNESHAGTARARGLKSWLKKRIVCSFHAALVGGTPHVRYYMSLGLPQDRIFPGYDAVDNDYFARQAEHARGHSAELRKQRGLPERYFLSLGRFVSKKNLATLIRAFRSYLVPGQMRQVHLVMVGSGEEESGLRNLCRELRLPVYDHAGPGRPPLSPVADRPGVHFYGFRQIDENPAFYALADAFILPSQQEEWGLVVNEAMASGLPVVVSETAGCAEDLLEPGWPPDYRQRDPTQTVAKAGLHQRIRQNGFVFDPKSSGELSRILRLLDARPELRKAMGQASQRIIARFSCRNFAANALLAAQAAMNQPAPAPSACDAGKQAEAHAPAQSA
jgi:glycosyltransferase involved in cell wall biosynthesis